MTLLLSPSLHTFYSLFTIISHFYLNSTVNLLYQLFQGKSIHNVVIHYKDTFCFLNFLLWAVIRIKLWLNAKWSNLKTLIFLIFLTVHLCILICFRGLTINRCFLNTIKETINLMFLINMYLKWNSYIKYCSSHFIRINNDLAF